MRLLLSFMVFMCLGGFRRTDSPEGIYFRFKQREMQFIHPMRKGEVNFLPRGKFNNKKLDTLSNWYDTENNYIEIIRQDNPMCPTLGVAFGFEFDEKNTEFPYTPTYAVLQLKDFSWGGVEFSPRDTLNYTGVTNSVSDDLTVEVFGYQNDTIRGRFYGVLLNGAGTMAAIDSGTFRVRIYRK